MNRPRGFTLIEVVTVMGIFALLAGIVISNMQRGKQSQVLREASQALVDNIRLVQNKTAVGTSFNICKRNEGVNETTYPDVYQGACSTVGDVCSDQYTCARVFPLGGYGIFLDHSDFNSYTLFADFGAVEKRNGSYGIPVQYEGINDTDSLVQEVVLPEDVYIAAAWITPQFIQDAGLVYTQAGAELGETTCYNPSVPAEQNVKPLGTGDISMAWIPPDVKMYTVVSDQPLYGICPDYTVSILLEHRKAETCRVVIINGASGFIDEKSDASCTIP